MIYEENIAVFAKQNCLPKGLGLECGRLEVAGGACACTLEAASGV